MNFREIELYHTKTYKHEIKHELAEIWPVLLHNNYIKLHAYIMSLNHQDQCNKDFCKGCVVDVCFEIWINESACS